MHRRYPRLIKVKSLRKGIGFGSFEIPQVIQKCKHV
jgi:hypothetical protein